MNRLEDNTEEAQRAITEMQERVLTAICLFIQSKAKEYCPVKTGNLSTSIGYSVEGQKGNVGTNVEYALKMEKGGSQQAKDGYLTIAAERHIQEIEDLIRRYGVIR